MQFSVHLCLCLMSQFFMFIPSSTTSGSYICHKVVSRCRTQGWWDMKNGSSAEVLKRNRVTSTLCYFFLSFLLLLSFCIRMISMDLMLASFMRVFTLCSLNTDRAARLNLHFKSVSFIHSVSLGPAYFSKPFIKVQCVCFVFFHVTINSFECASLH